MYRVVLPVLAITVILLVLLFLMWARMEGPSPTVPDDDDEPPPDEPQPEPLGDRDSDGDGMPDWWELLWVGTDPTTGNPLLDPHDPTDIFEDPDGDGYDFDGDGRVLYSLDMVAPSHFLIPIQSDYEEVSPDRLVTTPQLYDGDEVLLRRVVVMDSGQYSQEGGAHFKRGITFVVAEDAGSPPVDWITVTCEPWSRRPAHLDVYDPNSSSEARALSTLDVHGVFRFNGVTATVVVRGEERFTNLMEYQSMYYSGPRSLPEEQRDWTHYNRTDPAAVDSDGDGMTDGWEAMYGRWEDRPDTREPGWTGIDPTCPEDSYLDPDGDLVGTRWNFVRWLWVDEDGDGVFEPPNGNSPVDPVQVGYNYHEYLRGTDPWRADTDADSYPAGADSMNDFDEVVFHGTDPLNRDSDGDGMSDGYEVWYNLDPLYHGDRNLDYDLDGLVNEEEYGLDTDPRDPDTDGDLMPDGWEAMYGLDPADHSDGDREPDGDGLLNWMEFLNGTDPLDPDTDGDHLSDYDEVVRGWYVVVDGRTLHYFTDPLDPDTDGDDDLDDEDGDGVSDPHEEVLDGIDNDGDAELLQSNGVDDDGDGVVDDGRPGIPAVGMAEGVDEEFDLNDYNEVMVYRFNATLADTDEDGLSDHQEWFTDLRPLEDGVQRTQPTRSDTDDDGLSDREEVEGEVYVYIDSKLVRRPTDPLEMDTDGDGLSDGYEVLTDFLPLTPGVVNGTDPLMADTDGDGLDDGYEFLYSDLDLDGLPTIWELDYAGDLPGAFNNRDVDRNGRLDMIDDWDGDGLVTVEEFMWRCDPWDRDTDGDGVSDGFDHMNPRRQLRALRRLPLHSDSDGDLMPDWWEALHGLDLKDPNDRWSDPDRDFLVNIDEFIYDLDPRNPDTDGDTVGDHLDHEVMGSPDCYDSDGDGIADWFERSYPGLLDHTDPADGARNDDGDNWTNYEEWSFARDPFGHVPTDPFKTDTDGDGRADDVDLFPVMVTVTQRPMNPTRGMDALNPLVLRDRWGTLQSEADMDRDGLSNYGESTWATGAVDPTDPDTDADGMPDGWEARYARIDPMTGRPNLDPLDPTDAFEDPDWDGFNYSLIRDPEGNWIITHSDRNGDGFLDPTFENETFCNLEEYLLGLDFDRDGINDDTSDPNKWDTDDDGIPDGWEVLLMDHDGDGYSTWHELVYKTDPLDPGVHPEG